MDTDGKYIMILKEPDRKPFMMATFGHIILLDGNIESEAARAGRAVVGTKEELHEYLESSGVHFDKKHVSFIPFEQVEI